MTLPPNPYQAHLGNREPIASMRESSSRIRALVTDWSSAQFERTYAPGKWTARQVLIHLAQTELALGNRARMALTGTDYVAQPFEQDAWVAREPRTSGPEAVAVYYALRQMNIVLFASLSPDDRATPFRHPEYGALTVDWLIHQMAGHDHNHLAQLETIARA